MILHGIIMRCRQIQKKKENLRDGELNPDLARDKRPFWPLNYRGLVILLYVSEKVLTIINPLISTWLFYFNFFSVYSVFPATLLFISVQFLTIHRRSSEIPKFLLLYITPSLGAFPKAVSLEMHTNNITSKIIIRCTKSYFRDLYKYSMTSSWSNFGWLFQLSSL